MFSPVYLLSNLQAIGKGNAIHELKACLLKNSDD